MRVHTFGCSFTYGMKNNEWDTISWPERLAKDNPEIQVIDYSFPGTSIEYSLSQYDYYKDTIDTNDKVIFQITLPFRFTTFDNERIKHNRYNKLQNYEKYKTSARDYFERYVPGLDKDQNVDGKFHKYYYKKHLKIIEKPKFKALCAFINDNSDFCFASRSYEDYFEGITILEDEFGYEMYQKYMWDDAGHQNYLGSRTLSKYIIERLEL